MFFTTDSHNAQILEAKMEETDNCKTHKVFQEAENEVQATNLSYGLSQRKRKSKGNIYEEKRLQINFVKYCLFQMKASSFNKKLAFLQSQPISNLFVKPPSVANMYN